jgi:hypothetical protein
MIDRRTKDQMMEMPNDQNGQQPYGGDAMDDQAGLERAEATAAGSIYI